ncbi:hypothetical protein B9Z55_018351 [Caenorhabditis nigoni]|nr:hypothetical protein B9Z55_018351 [Caenorhabditis nigoni]
MGCCRYCGLPRNGVMGAARVVTLLDAFGGKNLLLFYRMALIGIAAAAVQALLDSGKPDEAHVIEGLKEKLTKKDNEVEEIRSQLEATKREKDEQAERIRKIGVETLQKATDYFGIKVKAMKHDIDKMNEDHNDEINQLQVDYAQRIERMQNHYSKEREDMDRVYDNQMERFLAAHAETLSLYDDKLEALEERRHARDVHDRMIEDMNNKIDEIQENHDDEISRMQFEYAQEKKQLQEEKSKKLKQMEKDHKNQMTKLQESHDAIMSKLEYTLETMKREGQEKIEKKTEENEQIALQQMEERFRYQEKISRLETEHQEKVLEFKMIHRQLQEKIHEDKSQHLTLEQKLKLEVTGQLNSELSHRISQNNDREVLKEFLRIKKTMESMEGGLSRINALCSSKLAPEEKSEAELKVQEIESSVVMFTNQVYQFRQFIINTHNVDQKILGICQISIRSFEHSLESDDFMRLCAKLPAAIKARDKSKCQKLGKMAGELSIQLKGKRIRLTDELDHTQKLLSVQNPPQLQIQ